MNGDRMHPIVVKEVRQGLKAKSFVGAFLALQSLMVVAMVVYLLAVSDHNSTQFADGLFWFLLGIVLVLMLPLRAFQGIHEEKKAATLELLAMTRMTSWDIVWGKWLALVLQLLLLMISVLPYLVLRYFIGSINIAEDLITVGLLALSGMSLTALGLAISGWSSKLLRGAVIGGAVMSIYTIPIALYQVARAFPGSSSRHPELWGFGLAGLVLLVGYLLVYGASVIAPPAENHARTKRLIALGMFGVFAGLMAVRGEPQWLLVSLVFMIPVCIDALCEPVHFIPGLYRARRRRTPVFIRRLFYPGWPAGIGFVLALIVALALLGFITADEPERVVVFAIALTGTLLLPLALILAFKPNVRNLTQPYIVAQLVLFVLSLLVFTIGESMRLGWEAVASMIPLSALLVALTDNGSDAGFAICALVTVISLIIVLGRANEPWRRIRALESGS